VRASPYSRHYLDAKSRSGHLLATAGGDAAQPPEPVRRLAPRRLRGVPGVVRLASYLVPLRAPAPTWFRLHLYLDVASAREHVVLTHGTPRRAGAAPLVHVQHDILLERFPLRRPRLTRAWARARAAIARHGAGCVLFLGEGDIPKATSLALLARHLPRRGARWLGAPDDPAVRGLAHAGVRLSPPTS